MLFTKPKLSHKQRVLLEIKRHPGITSRELAYRVTHKFNVRISELRKDGYIIEARRKQVPGSSIIYGYHLVEDREYGDD